MTALRKAMLFLAATGLATGLYGCRRSARRAAVPPAPSPSAPPDAGPSAVPGPAFAMPGTGSESPNPAERLQDANLTGSPAGAGTPLAESGQADRPFDPADPSDDDAPVTTGLPDFTRGA